MSPCYLKTSMASQAQIEANRRNSQKSTGPATAAGKSASSLNALKTGTYAESLLIHGEDPETLDDLAREYTPPAAPSAPANRPPSTPSSTPTGSSAACAASTSHSYVITSRLSILSWPVWHSELWDRNGHLMDRRRHFILVVVQRTHVSLVAERGHWVYTRGSPGRQICGHDRDGQHQHCGCSQRSWIGGRYTE